MDEAHPDVMEQRQGQCVGASSAAPACGLRAYWLAYDRQHRVRPGCDARHAAVGTRSAGGSGWAAALGRASAVAMLQRNLRNTHARGLSACGGRGDRWLCFWRSFPAGHSDIPRDPTETDWTGAAFSALAETDSGVGAGNDCCWASRQVDLRRHETTSVVLRWKGIRCCASERLGA